MPHTTTPPRVIVLVARQQHGYPPSRAICPWCGKPGATEPHHWLLKRSDTVPQKVLHDPRNVVLLHRRCHDLYGQTEVMTILCYLHKMGWLTTYSGRPANIQTWLQEILENKLVTHKLILPKEVAMWLAAS